MVLARDSQLWKSAYYDRFVRPRALRLPGLRDQGSATRVLSYSSKVSKWLEDDRLVRAGQKTNWKRQYKLRHNWTKGSCKLTKTKLADHPVTPEILLRLHDGIVVTADLTNGLRAWSTQSRQRLLASRAWGYKGSSKSQSSKPTSLAIDTSIPSTDRMLISVGFKDGRIEVFSLDRRTASISHLYTHTSTPTPVNAIAFSFPYLLTMTDAQLLTLFLFSGKSEERHRQPYLGSPRLITSLKSHTAWPPLSLSIRYSRTSVYASVAYAMPTYLAGWSVGLQELHLTFDGTILESRLASTFSQGFASLSPPGADNPSSNLQSSMTSAGGRLDFQNPSFSKPTSLSYNHPYLLAAHSDNTLTLYLVTSNAGEFSVGKGSRLWGHTSSVSGAHVGDRGRAVSVSRHGNDVRVWELEGGVDTRPLKSRAATGNASVRIEVEKENTGVYKYPAFQQTVCKHDHPTSAPGDQLDNDPVSKGWVTFDEEKIILLSEQSQRGQALMVYDFT